MRVIRRAPRRSTATDSMNPAAAEIRCTIRSVLASWAGLVAEERRLRAPARDIPELSRFLGRHVDWLVRHPAAGDMADEIQDLARTARGIAYPDSVRRVPVGSCPHGDCDGDLVALIGRPGDVLPSRIACTASAHHSWPVTWWNRLAHRMRSQGDGA